MSKIMIEQNEKQFTIVDTEKTQSINISYSNLNYTITQGKSTRKILNNLEGTFKVGLNAILGGSGAGKTSFLNILSKKIENNKKQQIEGKISANGIEYDNELFQSFANYVMQEDILLSTLTVREYLEFAANLKLQNYTQEQRMSQVNKIIKLLMLQKCENTLVGDHMSKGISGGERKRVCIGIELLGNPKVLFLDEPTSGLDSFTAYMIIKMLKNYSEEGDRTIIFTIHQPSSDIWELFDRITLLVEGKFIYNGLRSDILSYFSDQGFNCPLYSNPADYFMSLMQLSDHTLHKKLWDAYDNSKKQIGETEIEIQEKKGLSSLQSFSNIYQQNSCNCFYVSKILIKRQLINIKRNRLLLKARIFQSLFMNLFLGLIYLDTAQNQSTPQEIVQICKSILLIGLGGFFSSMNPQTITFSLERAVFLKEEGSRMYTTLNYFLSKIIPEIVVCTYFGFQVSVITYFMAGFESSASKFFFYTLNYVLINNIGNAMGVLGSSMFEQPKVAVSFAITFMLPLVLFSGIYKNIDDLPVYVEWCKYLTPTFYQTNAIVMDQFEGNSLIYDPIQNLHYDFNKWYSVLLQIVLYICINISAFLFLLFRRRKLQ